MAKTAKIASLSTLSLVAPEASGRQIHGSGEMASLTRNFDWSRTPLGPVAQWPDELLLTVNTLLATRHPMFLWWGDDLIQFYNDAYRPSIGLDKHPSALGQRGKECWPEIWHIIGPQIDSVITQGTSTWSEDALVPIYRNGKLEDVYWTYSYSPVRDVSGAVRGVLVTCSETTGRVLAERHIQQVLEATTDAVLTIDRDWTITYVNQNAKRMLARSGELLGKNFWETYPATIYDESLYVKNFRAAMENQTPGEFEAFYPEPLNGWYQVNVRPGADGIILFISDITDRKHAENAVRSERARLFAILQQAPAFFALLQGPDHVITMVNPLYLRLVNNRDVLGKPVRIALPETVEQGYIALLDHVYKGEPYAGYAARYDAFAGEGQPLDERYIDFIYQPLRETDGSVSGIIVLGVDVTDRKKAQDALLQTEKLAAVGRLASSIAHEINNPLEAVTNLLYLSRRSDAMGEIQEYLGIAEQELHRVAVICTQTLQFHRQATNPTEIRCFDLLEGAIRMYRGRIANSKIHVERRNRCEKAVYCFGGEIRQVLNNLISNAIDAMHPAGGRLLVRSRAGTNWKTGKKGAFFTIADTGKGMSVTDQTKAFNAFFTTKGIGGTGLGLWISKEIASRHHGKLRLRSSQRPGRSGTVFTLFLPFEAVTR